MYLCVVCVGACVLGVCGCMCVRCVTSLAPEGGSVTGGVIKSHRERAEGRQRERERCCLELRSSSGLGREVLLLATPTEN